LEVSGASLQDSIGKDDDAITLSEALLRPTNIYVKTILQLVKQFKIHAIAHITGGGLTENVPRVLPVRSKAVIDVKAWDRSEIFTWLQQQGNIEEAEMLRTFNCGIGMVIVVPASEVEEIISTIRLQGMKSWAIGSIDAANNEAAHVEYV
jgi:phosphoribosylformylglycinamidine cyclo-ligase